MSTLFECRWADCRKEFDDKDQYKAHIRAHVDAHEPTPIRDIPNFRRAAGFSIGPSAPQPGFDYLNSEGSQPLKAMSPDIYGISSQNHFSALGLGSQITPPISPMVQSPSLSAQIRSIQSPVHSQGRAQSPMYGLAAPFSDIVTPDTVFDVPRRITPPPTEEETRLMEDMIKTPTPPPEIQLPDAASATPSRAAAKRKKSAVKFTETTPAYKKRKIIPKTPYPDSEDDSELDGEGSEDETFIRRSPDVTGEIEDLSASPFIPQSQAPNQNWDDSQEHSQEHSNLYIEEVISNGEQDELISEEEEAVASQLGDYLEVEDITDSAPENKA